LLLAARIQRHLCAAGIMVITQIMGLVLAAVQQIVDGALEVLPAAPTSPGVSRPIWPLRRRWQLDLRDLKLLLEPHQ
jgi:hypothetical protein